MHDTIKQFTKRYFLNSLDHDLYHKGIESKGVHSQPTLSLVSSPDYIPGKVDSLGTRLHFHVASLRSRTLILVWDWNSSEIAIDRAAARAATCSSASWQ